MIFHWPQVHAMELSSIGVAIPPLLFRAVCPFSTWLEAPSGNLGEVLAVSASVQAQMGW
jgi:hypothetical protein